MKPIVCDTCENGCKSCAALRRDRDRLRKLLRRLLRTNIVRPKSTRGYINVADALCWHDDTKALLVEIEAAIRDEAPPKRRKP